MLAATSGLLALLGGVLAVPGETAPTRRVDAATSTAVPLGVPWVGLAVGAVLVPALAAAGGAGLPRTHFWFPRPTERLP